MKANEENKDLNVEETPEESGIKLTEEQEKELLKAFEEAKQPITLTDGKFKLGEREINIMSLSKKYRDQIFFRMMCHVVSYDRAIHQDLVDIIKLAMIGLKKLGVEDVVQATADLEKELMNKYQKEVKAN